jgi:hypothetical protein
MTSSSNLGKETVQPEDTAAAQPQPLRAAKKEPEELEPPPEPVEIPMLPDYWTRSTSTAEN